MNRKKIYQGILIGLGWLVGTLFIYAAWSKIADPKTFAYEIRNYKILPLWMIHFFAILLPWWEITAGVGLFIPRLRQASAVLIFGMTSVFTIAIISAIYRGLDISCGCFGEFSTNVGMVTLSIDLAILLVMGLLILFDSSFPLYQKLPSRIFLRRTSN